MTVYYVKKNKYYSWKFTHREVKKQNSLSTLFLYLQYSTYKHQFRLCPMS